MEIVATNRTIKTISQPVLRDLAPAAFTSEAHSKMSKHYQFVNTHEVVKQLMKIGFQPINASQVRFRKENDENGYQFHKVVLFHPDFTVINKRGQIEEMFEVTLSNSHNGFCKFSLHGSFYRLACDNGMLCVSNDLGHLVTRHMGETQVNVEKLLNELSDTFQIMTKSVRKMKSKLLSNADKLKLAEKMAEARFYKNDGKHSYNLEDLLKPLRIQDKGNSLWNVYNVLQEKFIKGYDFNGSEIASETDKKAARKLRAVNHNIVQLQLNKKFFEAAQEFLS